MIEKRKIKKFTDLDCWREGHSLVLQIYTLTKSFPSEEKFGLTNQIRRAAVSVTSNIAEGFSRRTPNDKIYFYAVAQGSLTELQNQLLIARDLKYIKTEVFKKTAQKTIIVHKLITGLIKSINKKKRSISR